MILLNKQVILKTLGIQVILKKSENRYRIEKAVALLQDKEKPIRDIAIAVGFDDQNYFSRVFKKFAGKSPMEYREDI